MQIRNLQFQAFRIPPVSDQQSFCTQRLFLSVVNLTTNTSARAIPVQRVSDSGSRPNPEGVLELLVFLGAQHWWSQNSPDPDSSCCGSGLEQELGMLLIPFMAPCPAELQEGLSVIYIPSWQVFVQVILTGIDSWLVLLPVLPPPQHTQSYACTLLSTTALLYTAMLTSIHIKLMFPCLKEDQEKTQSDKRQKADRQFGSLIKINCKPM